MRVVVALGGNAMTSPDGLARPEDQRRALSAAMESVADLVVAGHEVVITHGNGPQVGNLLVKNEIAAAVVPPVPLDWCVAQTQATIGYMVSYLLEAALDRRGVHREVSVLVTRTLVDRDDPGFTTPTKPIGRYLPQDEATVLMDHGQVWQDCGPRGWRRVVASPHPLEVLETPTMRELLGSGHVVVAAGGGGIPVVRTSSGAVRGAEAVIDKDLTAALLARELDADVLVIATDIDHAAVHWGTPQQRDLGRTPLHELESLAAQGEFASGSMGPKMEAAMGFVRDGGRRAVITSLAHIVDAVDSDFGTVITAEQPQPDGAPERQPPGDAATPRPHPDAQAAPHT